MPKIAPFLFFFLLTTLPFSLNSQSNNQEKTILLKLKQEWNNPPPISSWNTSTAGSHCNWTGVTCTDGSVTELHLTYRNIKKIPPSICDLENLTLIDLSFNNIPGEFPTHLYNCSKLQSLDLSRNDLVGRIPVHIDRLFTLTYLDLSVNNFYGDIPPSLGRLPELKKLYLFQNQFNGSFPTEIGNLSNLEELLIAKNEFLPWRIPKELGRLNKLRSVWMRGTNLIGEIPIEIGNLVNLESLDFSTNNLTGRIPHNLFLLKNLTSLYLAGNDLSGEIPKIIETSILVVIDLSMNQLSGAIPPEIGLLSYLDALDLSHNYLSGAIPSEICRLNVTTLDLSSNQLTGRIPTELDNSVYAVSLLNNTGLCGTNFGVECLSKSRKSSGLQPRLLAMIIILCGVVLLVLAAFAFFVIKEYHRRKCGDFSSYKMTLFQRLDFTESNILSNLNENNLIGSGGSGKVYLVSINSSGNYVAVKKIWNNGRLDKKLENEYEAEIQILGKIRHLNIVKLLCYISDGHSQFEVYEYMENRSLDQWLHCQERGAFVSSSVPHPVLDWPTRMHIAVGAAKGLCYMHHHCSPPIIHRDIKTSNILLDSEFNAKIADFGLAKMLAKIGEFDTMSVVVGSLGYMAPEYAHTTRVNEKIDVFSYGVVLLELVTGREAKEGDEHTSLVEWAWRHFQEGNEFDTAFDEGVKEPAYLDEMKMVFKLGLMCTGTLPSSRPSMKEVLQILVRSGYLQAH